MKDRIRREINCKLEEIGMSQKKLAERAGIKQSQLSRFITGKSGMDLDKLGKIMDVLEINVDFNTDKSPIDQYCIAKLSQITAEIELLRNTIASQSTQFIKPKTQKIIDYRDFLNS